MNEEENIGVAGLSFNILPLEETMKFFLLKLFIVGFFTILFCFTGCKDIIGPSQDEPGTKGEVPISEPVTQSCQHFWEWVKTKTPSAYEEGEEILTCLICSQKGISRIIPALGSIGVNRYIAVPDTCEDAIKYSFRYGDYDFYYIYLGQLRNIPIFSFGQSIHGGGLLPTLTVTVTDEVTNSISQEVSNSHGKAISITESNTFSRTEGGSQSVNVTVDIQARGGWGPVSVDARTTAEYNWEHYWEEQVTTGFSETQEETTSRTDTVGYATARTQATIQSSSITIGKDIPAGFVRLSMFIHSDVYLYVIRNIKTGERHHEFREYVRTNEREAWGWEFCADNLFEKSNDTNFTFDVSMLENLPVPELNLSPMITFHANGGNFVPDTLWLVHGALIPEPEISKEGNFLIGWYRNADFTDRWNFAEDKVAASVALYAKWFESTVPVKAIYVNQEITEPGNYFLSSNGFVRESKDILTVKEINHLYCTLVGSGGPGGGAGGQAIDRGTNQRGASTGGGGGGGGAGEILEINDAPAVTTNGHIRINIGKGGTGSPGGVSAAYGGTGATAENGNNGDSSTISEDEGNVLFSAKGGLAGNGGTGGTATANGNTTIPGTGGLGGADKQGTGSNSGYDGSNVSTGAGGSQGRPGANGGNGEDGYVGAGFVSLAKAGVNGSSDSWQPGGVGGTPGIGYGAGGGGGASGGAVSESGASATGISGSGGDGASGYCKIIAEFIVEIR